MVSGHETLDAGLKRVQSCIRELCREFKKNLPWMRDKDAEHLSELALDLATFDIHQSMRKIRIGLCLDDEMIVLLFRDALNRAEDQLKKDKETRRKSHQRLVEMFGLGED